MSLSIIFLLKRWNIPIINKKLTQEIASLSLGVYLIHPIVLDIFTHTKLGPNSFSSLISVPLLGGVIFFVSLLAAKTIRYFPYVRRII